MIGYGYDEKEVVEAIANGLDNFYKSLIDKINTLDINKIMKRKNPYLYRAKAMQNATDIVSSVLDAFVTSSEETIFGNCFFEPLAIAASGGSKALAEGVDIMVEKKEENTIYAVAVKADRQFLMRTAKNDRSRTLPRLQNLRNRQKRDTKLSSGMVTEKRK